MTKEKKVLNNVSAVHQPSDENSIIGYLSWYSVGEDSYNREALRKAMLVNSIEEKYLPNPIKGYDAFRRATKAVETKKDQAQSDESTNEYRNYIVRDVVNRAKRLQRNIVIETVNQKGEQLAYEPEGAKLFFDKTQQNLEEAFSYEANDELALELAEEAKKLFNQFLTHHNGQAVRASVVSYLNELSPVPVRPSGGVYFIPINHAERLRRLVNFVSSLERGESHMIPLVSNDENKNMIKDKVKHHLEKIILQCKAAIHSEKELKSWEVRDLVDEARRTVKQFKDYEKILNDTAADLETSVQLISRSIVLLLDRDVN